MRIINKELLKTYKATRCVHCGNKMGVVGHHIRSVGSGGGDVKENLIPLCCVHHIEIHKKGLNYMCEKNTMTKYFILELGWYWDDFNKTVLHWTSRQSNGDCQRVRLDSLSSIFQWN